MKTHHYIISGRVQGVAFRHYTQRTALDYHIVGTVRNLPNGDVEVYAQGEPDHLRQFEAFLLSGPRTARVTHVQHHEYDYNSTFSDFHILY